MTTPEPEPKPARAEPVGGDAKRLPPLFAASVSSDGRPALQWIGHGRIVLPEGTSVDTLADFLNRIVDMERPAPPVPTSDAGLAEVERLLTRIGDASLEMIECEGPAFDVANNDHDEAIADVRQAFATQAATITALRADNDRLRADAVGRGEGVFGPERHMDEIDAAREAFGWLEALALKLPRIANEQITIEREDVGVRVYWRENKPHAVMLTIRDGLNFTFGMGFNLARIAAAPAPATTDNSGDTHA